MDPTNDIEAAIDTFFDQLQDAEVAISVPPTYTQCSASLVSLPDDDPRLTAEGAPDASVDRPGPSKAPGLADVDPLQTNEVEMTVPPTYVQLSALLADLPDDEQSRIVKDALDVVVKGLFKAAGLADTIKIDYRDSTGKRIRRTLPDLAISPSPEFAAWLEAQRRESCHRAMVRSGKVQTTMQRIGSGQDDFDALAGLTRRTLAQQRTKRKK